MCTNIGFLALALAAGFSALDEDDFDFTESDDLDDDLDWDDPFDDDFDDDFDLDVEDDDFDVEVEDAFDTVAEALGLR